MNLKTIPWWLLAAALLFTACRGGDAPSGAPVQPSAAGAQALAERDTVLARLGRIDDTLLRGAFAHLPGFSYTRYLRTEQFDADQYLLAYVERVEQYPKQTTAQAPAVVALDTAGDFDYGLFNRFTSSNVEHLDAKNLSAYILLDAPAYLFPRHYEAYAYHLRPDTVMWDQAARVIEVQARPDAGDGQNIRRVRYYVSTEADRLIAMYLERIDLTLFFREESQFFVHIRPTDGGVWVPYNTRFRTRIRTPFRAPQHFRTVATYYNFE